MGKDNFVSQIIYTKTAGFETNTLGSIADYILWYGKNIKKLKVYKLFIPKNYEKDGKLYSRLELATGERLSIGQWERENQQKFTYENRPKGSHAFQPTDMSSQGAASEPQPFEYNSKIFYPARGSHWKANYPEGLKRLKERGRILETPNSLRYVRYFDDFPWITLTNIWSDTGTGSFLEDKLYVVQTATKAIQRCMLMTTDPDDLVLDITCGSGTTAYVAEQWGRRWITCDTSRIAIELTKERLMTATFDYYKLAHPEQGISGGLVYKTVPHITLKSIANNEPPATETLYDQPEIDPSKVRVTGPFTVEALPAPMAPPTVKPLDDITKVDDDDITAKQADWRDELLATGILGKNGKKLEFSRVEPLAGTTFLQAEGETKEAIPRRAVICFGSEEKALDVRYVSMAMQEAEELHPAPKVIIFAAFQFTPEAAQMIDDAKWPNVALLKVQMNTDLMTDDLKKKRSSNQSFWLIGQPDIELIHDKRTKDRYKVKVNGFDYYNVKNGTINSGSAKNIAMWMLDTDYDGLCIEPCQVFFPMGGNKGGWKKLAKTLKAEINQDLIEQYADNESLWFNVKPNSSIAVKIIDDRGIESLKVLKVGDQ